MSPKYRRQNRNVCDLVLIFSRNQRLFFLEVRLYRSPSFNKCYDLYCDKTKGDFKATWCVVVDKLWITPVYASHESNVNLTSKNNIQWWKILPSSDKEITPLKSSWSLGYNLRKRIVLQRRIVLVLLTAVDLRQTIMYAAWPDNISLQSTSLPPKGFQRVPLVSITIFISSYLHFFSQIQVVRRSLSLSIKMIYHHVLRNKKKEPALFWSANFPRLPRQFK